MALTKEQASGLMNLIYHIEDTIACAFPISVGEVDNIMTILKDRIKELENTQIY